MEDRLSKLEKTVQGFNLVTNGVDVEGGFGELKSQASLEERVSHLEQLHDNFRIQGGLNVTVEGSLKEGYAICSTCPQADDTSGPGAGGVGTPVITGACCVDGVCSIQTPAGCEGLGGDYQGDGTDCDPNPCEESATGACCFDDGSCLEENESDCNGAGGHYQGDNTVCDDIDCTDGGTGTMGACCIVGTGCDIRSPSGCHDASGVYQGDNTVCEDIPCCPCFQSPIDMQFYCNKVVHAVVTGSNPGGCDCTLEADWSSTFTCDPETHEITPSCSGTWHRVVTLTEGHMCVPGDVTENWVLYDGICGWNPGHADPIIDCCAGMGIPNPCGVARLDMYTTDCSYTCCDAQPGCFQLDITVTYF